MTPRLGLRPARPPAPPPSAPPGDDLTGPTGFGRDPGAQPFLAVVFTRSGLVTLGLGVALFALSLRAANPWLLLVSMALIFTLLVSVVPRSWVLPLRFLQTSPGRALPGQTVEQRIQIANTGGRSSPPLRLKLTSAGLTDARLHVPPLPPGGAAEVVLQREATARGMHHEHVIRVVTRAPFGLAERRCTLRGRGRLIVHPALRPPVELAAAGQGESPAGRPARTGHELHGLREWRQGDTRRQVHWRASAKRGEPVVVVPELTREPRLAMVVVGAAGDPDWEQLLSVAAWTAVEALRSGSSVRLTAAGAPDLLGTDPTAVLDWFAGLGDAGPPGAAVLAAVRGWAGQEGAVTVASTWPAGRWPAALRLPGAVHLTPDGRAELP